MDCLLSITGNVQDKAPGGWADCKLQGVTITIRAEDLGKNSLQCGRCSCIWGECFFKILWTNKQFNFFIVLINLIKLTSKVC